MHEELPVHSQAMDRMIVAQSTLRQRIRGFLEAHQAALKVSIDQALFIMPALGRGVFTSAALEQPDAIEDGRLTDDVVAVMLGYLT
jgi:hypothetical protein